MTKRDRQRLWLRCLRAAIDQGAAQPANAVTAANKFYDALLEKTDAG